jgi:hypothetical protein
MNVNVICDDGFRQTFSVGMNTTSEELTEKLCTARAILNVFTIKSSDCILRTTNKDSVFLIGSALISKHVTLGEDIIDISAIGFRNKVFEITQLYESTQRRESQQLDNEISGSTNINIGPFDAIFRRSDQFFKEMDNLLLQSNQNNQGDVEINRVLRLASGNIYRHN